MKRFFLFSVSLLLFVFVSNSLFSQVYEEFNHGSYGYVANSNARLVTHIIDDGDEAQLEALVIGYYHAGAIELSLYYDKDVVYPIYGPGGAEVVDNLYGPGTFGDFVLINPNVNMPTIWRNLSSGDINVKAAVPYIDISTGGSTLYGNDAYVLNGVIYPILKLFFKIRPGQSLSNTTFTYYEKTISPPCINRLSLGVSISMSGSPAGTVYIRPHMFARRIKSDVTGISSDVSGTSVTLTSIAEIVNRNIEMVPTDFVGERSGLDWDTILTTGFIYSTNNVAMTVEEYTHTLKIAGTNYLFPDATEIAAGTFTRGTYTFSIISTENTDRSYAIDMSETITGLDPTTEYCAYPFLLYRFQTSDPYPVLGEKECFVTECAPAIPPTVTNPYEICATIPAQTLATIPVIGTDIQWYADAALLTPLSLSDELHHETSYFVTQTIEGCESKPSSVTVLIVTNLDAPAIATPQEFCNASFTLADIALPAGINVNWYLFEDDDEILPPATGITNGTTYWAARVVGDCEGEKRTPVLVNVQATPAGPTIATPQYFCDGAVLSSIEVNPYNPADILWYEDAGKTTPITDLTTQLVSGPYYAVLNIGNGCFSAVTEVTIEIDPVDVEFLPYTYVSCENVKLIDIPISGWGIKWFSNAAMTTELDPTEAYPSGTYYAANSFGACLIPNMEVTVIVYDNVPPPTLDSEADNHLCDKSQLCLEFVLGLIDQQPGMEYKIYTNSTCTDLFTGCITAAVPYHSFYARAFVEGQDCGSLAAYPLQIDVIVDPLPAAPTINATANNNICEGLTITQAFLESLVTIPAATTVVFYMDAACTTDFTSIVANYEITPYTFYALTIDNATLCFSDILYPTEVTVNVTAAPVRPLVDATNGGELCEDANVMLYVTNTAAYTAPTYKWYQGATELIGETNPYYITNVVGFFTVVVNDGGCSNTSTSYEVTTDGGTFDYIPPMIQATNDGDLCEDANVMLYLSNVGVYGTGAAFQWYKNGLPIAGETNAYLIVDESGIYRIEVSVGGCSMVSIGYEVTLTIDIFDYVQPELAATNDGVLCAEANVMLYITNGNIYTNATYKWYMNGLPISATTPYLIVETAGIYHVEVIVDDCSMVSNGVEVTTSGETFDDATPPVIDATNEGVLCGDANVMIYLTNANVYDNPSYQWFYNGMPMTGETNAYVIVDNAGIYHIEVTVGDCSMVSNGINVTTSPNEFDGERPVIVVTNDGELCDGATALLYVENVAVYDAAAEYQWYKDGLPLVGETNSYLLTNSEGIYLVEVIVESCSMVSEEAEVTIGSETFEGTPTIAATNDGNLCDEANVMLYLTNAAAFEGATYQWYYNGAPMTGETNAYVIVEEAGTYHIEVIITPCSSVSEGMTVTATETTIDFPTPILTATNDGEICTEANVMLYLENAVSFTATTEYQWFRNGVLLTGETNSYLVTNVGGLYHVEVIVNDCSMVSNGIVVTIGTSNFDYPTPDIAASNDGDLCVGANIMLYIENVAAYGGATYQWFYEGILLTGETNSDLVVNHSGNYHVEISIDGCSIVSEIFTVEDSGTPFEHPQPDLQVTNDGNICNNANVMLYIANDAEYTDATYQWYLDGIPMPDVTSSYIITDVSGTYRVEVTIESCSMLSDAVEVTISTNTFEYPVPVITATNGGIICEDRSVILSVVNDELYVGATYQWFFYGSPIVGATNNSYEAYEVGGYHVEVIIGECSEVSAIYTITYKATCGVTLLGTVFPFVRQIEDEVFSELFTISVSLKAIPDPATFDPIALYYSAPLYPTVSAVYYDGTTFIPNTPKFAGNLGLFSNYGVPIDFQSSIGFPHSVPPIDFLVEEEEPINEEGMTVGLYRIDEVTPGDYILEIKRNGYIVRWAKINVTELSIQYVAHRELIPGDINADLAINVMDINDLCEKINALYHESDPEDYLPMTSFDLNADGRVTIYDVNLMTIFLGFRYFHYEDTKAWLDELGIDY